MAANEFDAFCRRAFEFLEHRNVRYLVIGGLAVVVVGEPRTTADADAIVFVSPAEAESLIREAAATRSCSTQPESRAGTAIVSMCRTWKQPFAKSARRQQTPPCGPVCNACSPAREPSGPSYGSSWAKDDKAFRPATRRCRPP